MKPAMHPTFSYYASSITVALFTLAVYMSHAVEGRSHLYDTPIGATVNVEVMINTTKIIHTTDERFVSVAFTIGDMRNHWSTYDLRSPRLLTLAKGLHPSYLRLGGTRCNFATFKEKAQDTHHQSESSSMKNFTFTGKDWDEINNFSRAVGMHLTFDVNEFHRMGNEWDSTNFKTLLDYNTGRNYTVAGWQIGNEPNAYYHTDNVTIPADQVAADYIKLRNVLNYRMQYGNALLFGPDVTKPHQKLATRPIKFLEGFLSKCGDCTNVTTFHSYYLSSHTASLEDFTDPSTLDALTDEIRDVRNLVAAHRPRTTPRIWLTETGDAVPGGVSGISDRYVGGFPYLDKLGVGAREGLEVIMKQQFIGRFCGLVNDGDYNPRPVYWVAYIHKQLVGQRVLNITTNQQGMSTLRIYAHCTQIKNSKYDPGDVTIIALNLDQTQSVQLELQDILAGRNVDEYKLMPSGADGLHSRFLSLNGIQLEMLNDTRLPELKPRPLIYPQSITLPPLSYCFYVILQANFKGCV